MDRNAKEPWIVAAALAVLFAAGLYYKFSPALGSLLHFGTASRLESSSPKMEGSVVLSNVATGPQGQLAWVHWQGTRVSMLGGPEGPSVLHLRLQDRDGQSLGDFELCKWRVLKQQADFPDEMASCSVVDMAFGPDASLYLLMESNDRLFDTEAIGGTDAVLAKITLKGELLFVRRIGFENKGQTSPQFLALSPQGRVLVLGSTTGEVPGQENWNGPARVLVVSVDARTGEITWRRKANLWNPTGLVVHPSGEFSFAAGDPPETLDDAAFILRWDAEGREIHRATRSQGWGLVGDGRFLYTAGRAESETLYLNRYDLKGKLLGQVPVTVSDGRTLVYLGLRPRPAGGAYIFGHLPNDKGDASDVFVFGFDAKGEQTCFSIRGSRSSSGAPVGAWPMDLAEDAQGLARLAYRLHFPAEAGQRDYSLGLLEVFCEGGAAGETSSR